MGKIPVREPGEWKTHTERSLKVENILENIYKAGLKFLVPLTLTETYTLIVQEALKLVKGEMGSILLERHGNLERVYASSSTLYLIKPRNRGFLYSVFKTRKPLILTSEDILSVHPEIKQARIRSDIAIPLSYRNKPIGVLTILSRKDKYFTERDLNILKFFGPLASLAIRKTQLYNETRIALELRDIFISMAAHELRTPLTSVNGYVQLLHSKLSGSNSVESRWVEQLSWETYRLTQLVNELLEINRIKSGKFQYIWKECSLREIINRAMSTFKFSYPQRKIVFKDELGTIPDRVVGEYNKLLQVITNLVDNAVKFSPADSEVTLALSHKGLNLILTISDLGIGIPKKDLSKIFDGYHQGSNVTREGLGLGLFLVNDVIKRHRGSLKVKSKLNRGTTVIVILPRIKL